MHNSSRADLRPNILLGVIFGTFFLNFSCLWQINLDNIKKCFAEDVVIFKNLELQDLESPDIIIFFLSKARCASCLLCLAPAERLGPERPKMPEGATSTKDRRS